MRRAKAVIPQDQMQAHFCMGRVQLDHNDRHRRRLLLKTLEGESILLDLPRTVHLRNGEGLLLEDGAVVAIEALPERLLNIAAPDYATLIRIAWHLGNRHLPTELREGTLRIREDHVLEDMVRGLGGTVTHIEASFDPESGAYAGKSHHHDHSDADHPHENHNHHHRHHEHHDG